MREKAIKDLAQLSDRDLFVEVAKGLDHVHANVLRLAEDARLLWAEKRPRGYKVLSTVAEEEAAKFLILLDAVRCPRVPTDLLSRHLGRFNDHLAKGIYVEYYGWRPANLGEVEKRIVEERVSHYLDGPNRIDWIFRNRIVNSRESAFYVDYVESDGTHAWMAPPVSDYLVSGGPLYVAPIIGVVQALHAIGIANRTALAVIAEVWRPVKLTAELNWYSDLFPMNERMREALHARGVLAEASEEAHNTVANRWYFPLHMLDLSPIPVKQDDLREARDKYWDREMGEYFF